jgi:molecular chaperone GrpE
MKEQNLDTKNLKNDSYVECEVDDQEIKSEATPSDEKCELEKLKADNESLKQQFLRSVADYTNLKQRSEREKREILGQANAKLIGKILPVIDNFERALQTINDEAVSKGVSMIYKQLLDLLVAEGLEKIDVEGEQFDPHFHEALMQEQNSDVEDNTILQVFEPGYRFNNKLLRAAKVKVSSN